MLSFRGTVCERGFNGAPPVDLQSVFGCGRKDCNVRPPKSPPGMEVHVGTSGWAYAWNQGGRSLAWFSEHSGLDAVELNASFYGFPSEKSVRSWAAAGSMLRWSVKVNRSITHRHRFNEKAVPVWERFYERFLALDDLVDFYLFQAPPAFADVDRLVAFVEAIDLGGAVCRGGQESCGARRRRGVPEAAGIGRPGLGRLSRFLGAGISRRCRLPPDARPGWLVPARLHGGRTRCYPGSDCRRRSWASVRLLQQRSCDARGCESNGAPLRPAAFRLTTENASLPRIMSVFHLFHHPGPPRCGDFFRNVGRFKRFSAKWGGNRGQLTIRNRIV